MFDLLLRNKFFNVFFFFFIVSYEYAGSVITYDDGNDGDDYKTANFASDQTTFDWDTATGGNRRDHAIHARITPSIFSLYYLLYLPFRQRKYIKKIWCVCK